MSTKVCFTMTLLQSRAVMQRSHCLLFLFILQEMKEEIPTKELVMNDYPPIEAPPKELTKSIKEEGEVDEKIKENDEIEDSPKETEKIMDEAEEAKEMEQDPAPKEEGEVDESIKENTNDGDDSSKKESDDEPKDEPTDKDEKEVEGSEEN
ncbi:MAG: hypothetical protein SGARI_007793, partial [Bacillariaceae sp.]